jgi:putative FmdB family regulatory protein
MPTYDYACVACGHAFEVFEPMSAEGRRDCPKCGLEARRRMGCGAAAVVRGAAAPPPPSGG